MPNLGIGMLFLYFFNIAQSISSVRVPKFASRNLSHGKNKNVIEHRDKCIIVYFTSSSFFFIFQIQYPAMKKPPNGHIFSLIISVWPFFPDLSPLAIGTLVSSKFTSAQSQHYPLPL